MRVVVMDEKGRTFVKEVKVIVRDGERLLSFGFPMIYSIDNPIYGMKRNYPFEHNIYIDGAGRNHNGSPVYVKKDDMNRIFEELVFGGDENEKSTGENL